MRLSMRLLCLLCILCFVGCSKQEPVAVQPPSPVCPEPCKPDPKDSKCKCCPNCPDCEHDCDCPKCDGGGCGKPIIRTKMAVGTVKELKAPSTGGLLVVLEGERFRRVILGGAEILIDGKASSPQQVLDWFEKTKCCARVKLHIDPVKFGAVIRAEFYEAK